MAANREKQAEALISDPRLHPEFKGAIKDAFSQLQLAFIMVTSDKFMPFEQAEARLERGI